MGRTRSRKNRIGKVIEYLRIALIGAALMIAAGLLFPLIKYAFFGGPPLLIQNVLKAAGFAVAFAVITPLLFWSAVQLFSGRLWRRRK